MNADPALRYQAELTVADLAARHAGRWNRRGAVAVACGDDRRTWVQLDERVQRLTGALAARGIRRGDVVALFAENRVEFFEIVLAAASLGAVAAPQSFRSSTAELEHGLDATGARLLVAETEGDLGARTAEIRARRPELDVIDFAAYEDLLAAAEAGPAAESPSEDLAAAAGPRPAAGRPYEDLTVPVTGRPSEDDAFWLALTGGTTGMSKVVRVPHRVIVQMWLFMAVEFGIGPRDTMLVAGPLHHGLGFGFALQQLYVGGRVVVLARFDAAEVLATIERQRVTVLPAAPTMLALLLDAWERQPADLSSLRAVVSAGSALPASTKRRLLAAVPAAELYEHYGATEAGFFTVLGPEDQLRKPGSCGTAFFGSSVAVLRDDDTPAPPGEVGLVFKRGLVQGGGYAGNPDASARMFRGDWCTVGDLGYLDDEGYLYLVDRADDMIVSGGVNIYPGEIEAVVAELGGVSEVAVVGVPDERWGQIVKAFVVARPGAALSGDDVVEACRGRLADYKRPRAVEFVPDLPKSAAGKVLKRELRSR